MEGEGDERAAIRRLVRELGAAGGARPATPEEIGRLRDFFGRRVLRAYVDRYILAKYRLHVERDAQWPDDTTPEEFLACLRETVLDGRSAIYLTNENDDGEWAIYFVGRVRRAWRGPGGHDRVVVLFNGERQILVTAFQADHGDAYVSQQGGFWVFVR